MKNRKVKNELMDFSFVFPSLALFAFIVVIPLISGIKLSLTDWDGISEVKNFVGLHNFITVIHDTDLLEPIRNTFLFTILTTVLINAFGLVLAMAVTKDFRGINVIKSIIFIPLIVSLVLVSVMWMYIYSDLFTIIGWESPLINKKTSMLGLVNMSIWREVGLAMMIYLAALKGVPSDMYEAAVIDGAGFWAKFRNVTIPFIAPAFTYCIPLWMGAGLRQYDYTYVATQGGPGHSSETIAYYIYSYLFPYYKVGYGQAVAVIFLVIAMALSYVVTSFLRKREIEL